jgi:hemin uptake protein HemP
VLALPVAPQPLDSQQLLQGRRELQILHQGQIYRLQQTRQGKLILTK